MAEQASTTSRVLRGALAGVIAGVMASFAMDRVQALAASMSDSEEKDEPATSKAADAVAEAVTGGPLPEDEKPLGGQAAHYALGMLLGAAYGIAAEFRPAVTSGFGTAFGAGTALLLDESAVPAAGLSDAPWKAPASTHVYAFASHAVFGVTAEAVRRAVDATLKPK